LWEALTHVLKLSRLLSDTVMKLMEVIVIFLSSIYVTNIRI